MLLFPFSSTHLFHFQPPLCLISGSFSSCWHYLAEHFIALFTCKKTKQNIDRQRGGGRLWQMECVRVWLSVCVPWIPDQAILFRWVKSWHMKRLIALNEKVGMLCAVWIRTEWHHMQSVFPSNAYFMSKLKCSKIIDDNRIRHSK